MKNDLYSTLGVARNAGAAEIKKAYRRLAKKYHPDATGGQTKASDRFKEVSAAFEILGDGEKRKLYDEFGEDSLRVGFDPQQARSYRQWTQHAAGGHGRPAGRDQRPPFAGSDARGAGTWTGGTGGLDDLLADLFSAGGQGGPIQPRDRSTAVEIDLATALAGGSLELQMREDSECSQCHGSGSLGQTARSRCMTCHGTGRIPGSTKLAVTIPRRTPSGSRLRLKRRHPATGDLVLEIKIRRHPLFERHGKDLKVALPITVDEAVLGAKVPLITPDGRTLSVTIPPGSQSGNALRLKGQGLGTGSRSGSLIVRLEIKVPEHGAEELARSMGRAYRDEVRGSPRG